MTEVIAFPKIERFPGTREILAGKDLEGKLAVITGGSGGLGLATATALASAGADIIIAARPGRKLSTALEKVSRQAKGRVESVGLDLSDLGSVDAAARQILESHGQIDILINNAGIIGQKALSSIGVEMGFMTNVVGHAVLASHLAPAICDGGRIACLSSFGHHYSPVVFEDINFEHRPYAAWTSYGQSKTGCALLAVKLDRALRHRSIDAFALHPGAIYTDMGRSMVEEDYETARAKTGPIPDEDFVSPDQGAATTVWAVTEPSLAGKGGVYLENCAVAAIRDEPDYRTGVMRYALDPALAEQLWQTIETLTGRTLPLA